MNRESLPANWTQCELSEVVDILDSQRIPVNSSERDARLMKANKTYPYYGATGQVGEIDDFIFEGESVLLGEDGAPFLEPYKPKAYIVRGRYWVNNHAHILRALDGVTNEFLCNQLNALDYRRHVSGTTRLKLTQGSLRTLPLKIAPTNEQRHIVERIETLFARIDKGEEALREVQKLIKRYCQSILKAAVTGELTREWREANRDKLEPATELLGRILQLRRNNWAGRGSYKEPITPEPGNLSSLPSGWTWSTTDQLAFVQTGATPKKSERRYYATDGIDWITSTAVNEDPILGAQSCITEAAIKETNAKIFPKGTLIVAMYGEGRTRGKVSELGIDSSTNQACAGLLVGHIPTPVSRYLKLYYQYNYEVIRKKSVGGVQPNLSLALVRETPIPLPPLDEIVEILQRTNEQLNRAKYLKQFCASELRRSSAMRQSILKSAFSGQLVPQDPNDEPASELLARIRAERGAAPRSRSRKKAARKKSARRKAETAT